MNAISLLACSDNTPSVHKNTESVTEISKCLEGAVGVGGILIEAMSTIVISLHVRIVIGVLTGADIHGSVNDLDGSGIKHTSCRKTGISTKNETESYSRAVALCCDLISVGRNCFGECSKCLIVPLTSVYKTVKVLNCIVGFLNAIFPSLFIVIVVCALNLRSLTNIGLKHLYVNGNCEECTYHIDEVVGRKAVHLALRKSEVSHVLVHVALTGIYVIAVDINLSVFTGVNELEVVVLLTSKLVAVLVHLLGLQVSKVTKKGTCYHVVDEVDVYVGSLGVITINETVDVRNALAPAILFIFTKISVVYSNVGCLSSITVSVSYVLVNLVTSTLDL